MPAREQDTDIDRRFDELYETYGKPLEADHRGEFLAISLDGGSVEIAPIVVTAMGDEAMVGTGIRTEFTVILDHAQRLIMEA